MPRNVIRNITVMIRDFLFSKINKEFLIFLFFLVLSTTYWFMSVLNDTMEKEIIVPVQLKDIPDNAIILTDETVPIRVTVRDKGYTVAAYLFGEQLSTVKIPFSAYAKGTQKCVVSNSELSRIISSQLFSSTKVLSIKPERLEFPYNQGQHKRIPVRLIGNVKPAESYHLARIALQPDSVTVYSSQETLDNLEYAITEVVNISNFSDTIQRKVRLENIKASKIVPREVTMTLFPDILVEAIASVPVTPINVPEGCTMRTFPSQVQVSYVTGASRYNSIEVSHFMVIADYSSTNDGEEKQCPIRLIKSPSEARNPKLKTANVDYLIEQ